MSIPGTSSHFIFPALHPSSSSPSPSSSPPRRFERRLKPLEELSDAYFLSLTLEQLLDTERRLRGARSALHTARTTRTLSRRLALTNFLFELWPRPEHDCDEDDERDTRLLLYYYYYFLVD